MNVRIGNLAMLAMPLLVLGCSGGSSGSGGPDLPPTGPADVAWTADAWTQPVPSWGSTTRLAIPYPLESLSMTYLGAFGSHQGGHPEGLDHVWLYNTASDQVQSWGAGTVAQVTADGGQTMVTIDYGDYLQGKHMSLQQAYVTVGQSVQAGDVIGLGITGALDDEFQLMDEHRGDGILTQVGGYSYVSPFDYLQPAQQAELLALYQAQVVSPFFALGQSAEEGNPWEPFLTNRTLIHHENRGTLIGEWVLGNRPWSTPDPLYFDILTLDAVTNGYGQFSAFAATDYNLTSPASKGIVGGTFAQPGPGQVTLTYSGSASPDWYGLYRIDESGGRATMSLEWSAQGFPAALDGNAALYYERANVYVGLDAQMLGVL